MLLCRWCLDLALGGEADPLPCWPEAPAAQLPLEQPLSHWGCDEFHLFVQRTLKPDWHGKGSSTAYVLASRIKLHESREPHLLYWKQQFAVASPAVTGSKCPEYWASNRTEPSGRPGPSDHGRVGTLCTRFPVSILLRPRRGPKHVKRGFSPIGGWLISWVLILEIS